MSLDDVRPIADAVMYEGYLLYPYRASSRKNQSRWQFGVLGPPNASPESFSEAPGMRLQCLVKPAGKGASITVHLRFLQLQMREAQRRESDGSFVRVDELAVDGRDVLSWDEAVEHERALPAQALTDPVEIPVTVTGGEDVELATNTQGEVVGRLVRRRRPLAGKVRIESIVLDGFVRISVSVDNDCPDRIEDKDDAIRSSLIGAHLLIEAHSAEFISLLEPPPAARRAAALCEQRRCWPVLAGEAGATDVLLGAPIILYDHPAIAEQSRGELFDSTEIDEILTLRVMTMTADEKAEARATDPRARAIIDRCDSMSAPDLQQLHGILHDSASIQGDAVPEFYTPSTDGRAAAAPWWDPESDASVSPDTDSVLVDGVAVARGSRVRIRPNRSADAQDIFFAGREARVTSIHFDVDGSTHVGVVLLDDPAADLFESHGRSLYFAPDEVEPLGQGIPPLHREESRS